MALLRVRVAADPSGLLQLATAARQRSVTLKGVKAGAKVVQRAAKPAAPLRTGALKTSIGNRAAKGSRGKTLAFAVIGPRRKFEKTYQRGAKTARAVPAFYAHLVEKGTRPHSLAGGAKLGRRGKAAVGQNHGHRHPGAKPHPFLGPAYDRNKGAVAEAMLSAIDGAVRQEIEKNSAKLLGKALSRRA